MPEGEEGELWVKGPQRFAGYWKREGRDREDHHPEGLAAYRRYCASGRDYFIQIVDRIKEVIITGGFNVSPTEVEVALKQHDMVADAAVVGIPLPPVARWWLPLWFPPRVEWCRSILCVSTAIRR